MAAREVRLVAHLRDAGRSPPSRGAFGARRSRRLLNLRDTARAMSQENVEITEGFENLRRGVEAWNREDLDAFLETWHPDCEWRPAFPRSLEGVGAVYQGREGIARAWEGVRG